MLKSDQMSQELKNLVEEMKTLQASGKIEEAHAKIQEIENMEKAIQVQVAIEEQEREEVVNKTIQKAGNTRKVEYNAELFYKAVTGQSMTDEEKAAVKAVNTKAALETGDPKEGGNTVPDDLSHEIIAAIKDEESIRNLVRIENAKSKTGTRIVRTGTPNRLHNTAERGAIQMINNPQYDVITYNQNKYAGILDIPNELLDDSFLNFKQEIITWLSDSARETENYEVFYGVGGEKPEGIISSTGKYIEVTAPANVDIKFLRKVKNSLKKGYRKNAKWVMNTQASEVLANIKDGNGRDILVPDPRNEDVFRLFGRPVEIFDTIETDDQNKTVILFGDFNRAYRLFPRKNFEIKMTDIGAGAYETDTVKARGIERFDGRIMDTQALVIVRDLVVEK